MAKVVPGVVHALVGMGEELDEEEEMVGLGTAGAMLVDWTDARRVVGQDEEGGWDEMGRQIKKEANGDIHLGLAEELLERALAHGCSSKERHCPCTRGPC
jgi:hypothetical protein